MAIVSDDRTAYGESLQAPAEQAVQVFIEEEATEADVAAVQALLARHAVPGTVDAGWGRKSADLSHLGWVVFLFVPGVKDFLKSAGTGTGDAVASGLRRLVTDLYEDRHRRTQRNGTVTLEDDHTATTFALSEDLPDEAYMALPDVKADGAIVRWDGQRWARPT